MSPFPPVSSKMKFSNNYRLDIEAFNRMTPRADRAKNLLPLSNDSKVLCTAFENLHW
jgi:hypothetical protein